MARPSITSPARYSGVSIGLHWLMLLLLAAVYALILFRELYPRGSDPREALKAWHFAMGLVVFGFAWLRIVVRIATSPPRRVSSLGDGLALLAHLALYALMIGMPLLGWMALSAAGKPIPFFGLEVPALVSQDKALASQFKEVHEVLGTVGYWLVGLHTVAALVHHYLLKDDTLRRMLPRGA